MIHVETWYAVRDPETGLYLSGAGPYDRWTEPIWEQRGSISAGKFWTPGAAKAAKNKRIRMEREDRCYGGGPRVAAERAIIVEVKVTTEFP